ncbi:hypothetical protein [Dialister invisus]|uniref:hypothetical protein n=1 Tax=Dialister invisus TaxID=218538 RepID=UPI003080B597
MKRSGCILDKCWIKTDYEASRKELAHRAPQILSVTTCSIVMAPAAAAVIIIAK